MRSASPVGNRGIREDNCWEVCSPKGSTCSTSALTTNTIELKSYLPIPCEWTQSVHFLDTLQFPQVNVANTAPHNQVQMRFSFEPKWRRSNFFYGQLAKSTNYLFLKSFLVLQ